jgi:hypothetical protein
MLFFNCLTVALAYEIRKPACNEGAYNDAQLARRFDLLAQERVTGREHCRTCALGAEGPEEIMRKTHRRTAWGVQWGRRRPQTTRLITLHILCGNLPSTLGIQDISR